MEQEKRVNVGHCVLILYLSQDDLESCRRDTVQSETPGGAYLICIVFIVYQHPCILLIHNEYALFQARSAPFENEGVRCK